MERCWRERDVLIQFIILLLNPEKTRGIRMVLLFFIARLPVSLIGISCKCSSRVMANKYYKTRSACTPSICSDCQVNNELRFHLTLKKTSWIENQQKNIECDNKSCFPVDDDNNQHSHLCFKHHTNRLEVSLPTWTTAWQISSTSNLKRCRLMMMTMPLNTESVF